MDRIYLDHAATTPLREEVASQMDVCNRRFFGNASSLHSYGQEAKKLLEESRSIVAKLINSPAEDIVFTSCGSESNNTAIKGLALSSSKRHIITSSIEHPSILNTCKHLETLGCRVTYLKVDRHGMVSSNDLANTLCDDTCLVSIQHVNNEVGVVQNISELASLTRSAGAFFHTDAVQSVGKLPLDAISTNIDLLSASAHKINGPKGIGFLYINPAISSITPLIHGGSQERKRRAGTVNLPAIVGYAQATALALMQMKEGYRETCELRDWFEKQVQEIFPEVVIHGNKANRIFNISSLSFPGYESDALLIHLDLNGICVSAGSACSSGSLQPSHVLTAMNVEKSMLHSTLRFSFGYGNSKEECIKVLEVLGKLLRKNPESSVNG